MRLLVASHHLRVIGGIETYLRSVLPLLCNQFENVGLITSDADDTPTDSETFANVDRLRCANQSATGILDRIDRWQPNVVYNHGLHLPELDEHVARLYPTVYYAHGYDATCISGTKTHAFPSHVPCERRLGAGCLGYYLPRRCGGWNPGTMIHLYRQARRRLAMLQDCRTVLAASNHMRSELIQNGIGADVARLLPLFPTDIQPTSQPPPRKPTSGRILFIGRLTDLKGWQLLLQAVPFAAERLGTTLTLIVAGDGPGKTTFEADARRLGLKAEFLGWINATERTAQMAAADVLAVPSIWPEPFGLIGIEAGCLGLPAVGFRVGGIPDWLISGVSGELVDYTPENAAKELGEAIVRILVDGERWQRLRVGAWKTSQRFSAKLHMETLESILTAVAQ